MGFEGRPDKGEYIVVHNNTSSQINTVRPGNNKMSGLPTYTWLAILAIIWTVPMLMLGYFSTPFHGSHISSSCSGPKRLIRETAALLHGYQRS